MTQKDNNRKRVYFHYQKEILNTISEPASFINTSFRYIFVNTAFNNFYHVKTKDIVGKPVENLWGTENFNAKIKPVLEQCINGEEVFFQYEGIIPNGDYRILKMNFYPHRVYPKGLIDGIISTSLDITEQKKAEKVQKQNEDRLEKLNATKDKLFSIIAHDLRSPFNSILGFSELLIENNDKYDAAESGRYLELIHSSAKNTLVLLDNLLNWAKAQTGQIIFKPKKIILSSEFRIIIEQLNTIAQIKNISLKYNCTDEIEVYTDENLLNIVIRNLVSNAIKFTNKGGKVTVSAISEQNHTKITISDNGIGMSEETRKKLFDVSMNITSLGTANEKGSGIGLLLCSEFIKLLGDEIWVESEEGVGSQFHFTIPCKPNSIEI